MLYSLNWLRELCPCGEDAKTISAALTARGLTVDSLRQAGDDHVFDLDIPANRPDCLGHLGVARELSAAFNIPMTPRFDDATTRPSIDTASEAVRIEVGDRCARYTARIVRGVTVRPSPDWVTRRLERCGLRSINNVVDASTLVLLELGTPIHFFDRDLLGDEGIRIRLAKEGERLQTLDMIDRPLTTEMVVISDGSRGVALAGVMGGAATEIRDTTQNVLIEAAWFEPRSIRATANALNVRTDACHRFERGVDPEAMPAAQQLAAHLLVELSGGTPDDTLIDHYPAPFQTRTLSLRTGQLGRLLGYQPDETEVFSALTALGLCPQQSPDETIDTTVPSWRFDLEREADLVEEVDRHLGYDRIPLKQTTLMVSSPSAVAESLDNRTHDYLSRTGFYEAFGYAMIGANEDDRFVPASCVAPLPLANPISETMGFLRRSILPGLLKATSLNLRRGNKDIRLYELGHVFLARGTAAEAVLPEEPTRVGMVWSGTGSSRHWSHPTREADLHDIAGVVQSLIEHLRPGLAVERQQCDLPAFHPTRSIAWTLADGTQIANCGVLHPDLQHEFQQAVFMAEVHLDPLTTRPTTLAQYRPLPKLGSVARDLALVIDNQTSYADLLKTLTSIEAPAKVRFQAVDRYAGAPLKDNEVSILIRAVLQPETKSLTDAEIEAFRVALVSALDSQLGIKLRG
jgi:phenylalanyl-tRNA synthetase beta chain